MSREIKFRAWDKKEQKMNIVCRLGTKGFSHHFWSNDPVICDNRQSDYVRYEFMQFTGLHDKYEKEIWEGDIVKFHAAMSQPISDVYWKNGFYMRNWEHLELDSTFFKHCKMWEVIGNIYENPELLEGEK